MIQVQALTRAQQYCGRYGRAALVERLLREPELLLEPARGLAVEHVLVAFDAAVAERELDQAPGNAALVRALVGVEADVHGLALFFGFLDEGIQAGGGRKT